jgi:aldose sugar dehydrogenase
MTDTTRFPAAVRPAWTTGSSSQGMAGGSFLSGAQWRDWNGAFVAALLAGRRLEVLQLDGPGAMATKNTPILNTLNVRLRSVTQGPDGALYVATDGEPAGDEIWRVMPN